MVLSDISSVWPKLALFSAGVFFHGAADHVVVATTGRAPDVDTLAPVLTVWGLASFDFIVAVVLYVTHRHFDGVIRRSRG